MAKPSAIIWTTIFCLIALALGAYVVGAINTKYVTSTLYAHSETQAIAGTNYKALKTTACNGPQGAITLLSASSGIVALGNSSAIQLTSIDSQILTLENATWTFSYHAKANVTEKTTLLTNILLVWANGTTKATLGTEVAETAWITSANTTKTGTATIVEQDVLPTDYLRVVWYANKTDVTPLRIDLWLDVTANPTKIAGFKYTAIITLPILTSMIQLTFFVLGIAIVLYAFYSIRKGRD